MKTKHRAVYEGGACDHKLGQRSAVVGIWDAYRREGDLRSGLKIIWNHIFRPIL